jgi:hypothetical protein
MSEHETVRPFERWKDVLWPIGGTVFGLIVMPVAIAQYPDFFNNNRWLLPLSVGVVLLCWIFPILIHENAKWLVGQLWGHGPLGKIAVVCLMAVLIGLALIGSRKLFHMHADHLDATLKKAEKSNPIPTKPESKQMPPTSPKPKPEPPKPPVGGKPPTLEQLFVQDFPYTLKATFGDIDLRATNGFELPIKRQIYMDFEGESKFVGFYMPAAGPDNDYDYSACMHLVDWVEKTITDFEKDRFVSGGTPGQMTTATNLKFSGRVLLYVGDDLSIEQEADIIKAYKAAGFDVQFRGPDYLSSRVSEWWRDHRKTNPK